MIFYITKVLLALLLLSSSLFADVVLEDTNQNIELVNLPYYEDKSGSVTLQEVQNKTFLADKNKVASFGFTNSVYWFKVNIEQKESAALYKWWLNVSYPLLDKIDIYTCDENNELISLRKSGKLRPYKERELKDRNFNFKIEPNIRQILYIRVKTDSSMQVPMSILTSEALLSDAQYKWVLSGIYYGIFLLIFFYNAISFIYTRSKKYFYYLVFISSFIIYQLSLDGLGIQYIWSEYRWMVEHGNGTMMGLMTFVVILFTRTFLRTSYYTPRTDKVLVSIAVVMSVVTFFAIFRPYGDVILTIAGVSVVLPFILIYAGIIAYKNKFYPARFYIVGWGSFLLGSVLFAMNKFAWIEGMSFLSYAQQIGSTLEMMFLSWALADLQKQSEREYVGKLNGLNEILIREVDEHLVQIRQHDQVLIEKSRLAAMGEMIEQIAHQWRQPLNTLALLNQNFYFKVQLSTVNKQDVEDTHDKINEQLQYMSQTIDDFRNFSHPNKKREVFCVEDAIQSSLNLSDGTLKLAKIKSHIFSKEKHYVFGMRHEMMQVFMNLIKNVNDAVSDKKKRDQYLKFSVEDKDEKIYIRIEDNAGGIDTEKIDKIFHPYFSTKDQSEGSGIGLYMSKEIVEGMSGTINVINNDFGAVFTIELPKQGN